jgi:hypothetical protein
MQRVTAFEVLGLALTIAGTTVSAQAQLDRTVLPIAEPTRPTYRELDARQAKPGTGDKSILRVNDMKVAGGTADPSRQGDSRHETQ